MSHLLKRLESLAPQTARRFQASGPIQRRNAVVAACELAASRTGLESPDAAAALRLLRSGVTDSDQRTLLERLAEQLDDIYFSLSDRTDSESESAAMGAFFRARAAAALAFALGNSVADQLEALYEACACFDDGAEVLARVENELGSPRADGG